MNVKSFVLGVAIIIATMSIVIFGMNSFYPNPEQNDFCGEIDKPTAVNTEEECLEIGGRWEGYGKVPEIEGERLGWCDEHYECREDYETARSDYSRNAVLIMLVLGVILIVFGVFLSDEVVGAGLMGGSVGILLYSIANYWRHVDDWLKLVVSIVLLLVFVWLSSYFEKKLRKKK